MSISAVAGADFLDGDLQGLEAAAAYELNRGVTRLCPAGMSLAAEQLPKICQMAGAVHISGQRRPDRVYPLELNLQRGMGCELRIPEA